MWTTEVCPALVFDKDLQICTGCLAMYSETDPSSTHPKTMGTRITDLCKQQGISTQELFFEALWNEAMRLFSHFGAVLMPRMSGVHTEAPKSKDAARDKKNTWTQARVHLLEQEVANLRLDKDRLSASNRVLKADYQVVLEKMVKQRKDSITQYEAAAREDLAQVERYELGIIQTYLPAQMPAEEVEALVVASIAEAGATSAKDMGKVIALVKPKVAGRTDMGKLSELVKQKLAALG